MVRAIRKRKPKFIVPASGPPVSELRQDLVTGEWVAIAQGRAKRPEAFIRQDRVTIQTSKRDCPLEDVQASGNAFPVLTYTKHDNPTDWSLQVIPNKYPAFTHHGTCGTVWNEGPFEVRDGHGFHEVIITRDHERHIALLSREEVSEVIRAYRARYLALKEDQCLKYIALFHNHGPSAGASLPHPHSQLIAIPVLPPDIQRSLRGSNFYFRKYGKCVHCVMNRWERTDKKRIVFENDLFIAFCPFVSRNAFEVRIFPKKHEAYFYTITDSAITQLADTLRTSLHKLYEVLKNPDYNFFIHTAPLGAKKYSTYHWHIEIVPKTATWAGFELSTGIHLVTIDPKDAAAHLRKAR